MLKNQNTYIIHCVNSFSIMLNKIINKFFDYDIDIVLPIMTIILSFLSFFILLNFLPYTHTLNTLSPSRNSIHNLLVNSIERDIVVDKKTDKEKRNEITYDVYCKKCNIVISDTHFEFIKLNVNQYIDENTKQTENPIIIPPPGHVFVWPNDYKSSENNQLTHGKKILIQNTQTKNNFILQVWEKKIENNSISYRNIFIGIFIFAFLFFLLGFIFSIIYAILEDTFNKYNNTSIKKSLTKKPTIRSEKDYQEFIDNINNSNTIISIQDQEVIYDKNYSHIFLKSFNSGCYKDTFLFIISFKYDCNHFRMIHDYFLDKGISYFSIKENHFIKFLKSVENSQEEEILKKYTYLLKNYHYPISHEFLSSLLEHSGNNRFLNQILEITIENMSPQNIDIFMRDNKQNENIQLFHTKKLAAGY